MRFYVFFFFRKREGERGFKKKKLSFLSISLSLLENPKTPKLPPEQTHQRENRRVVPVSHPRDAVDPVGERARVLQEELPRSRLGEEDDRRVAAVAASRLVDKVGEASDVAPVRGQREDESGFGCVRVVGGNWVEERERKRRVEGEEVEGLVFPSTFFFSLFFSLSLSSLPTSPKSPFFLSLSLT